jgi:uncharacterized ferredoxin-like protein
MTMVDGSESRNRELAKRINQEARANPNSPYANKYVGIAHGQVVAVADRLSNLMRLLDEAGVARDEVLCLDAAADYEGAHFIIPFTYGNFGVPNQFGLESP